MPAFWTPGLRVDLIALTRWLPLPPRQAGRLCRLWQQAHLGSCAGVCVSRLFLYVSPTVVPGIKCMHPFPFFSSIGLFCCSSLFAFCFWSYFVYPAGLTARVVGMDGRCGHQYIPRFHPTRSTRTAWCLLLFYTLSMYDMPSKYRHKRGLRAGNGSTVGSAGRTRPRSGGTREALGQEAVSVQSVGSAGRIRRSGPRV